MSRESLEQKAQRYLRESRVRVVWVDQERIEARVRGTEAEHVVTYERGGWACTCRAAEHGRRCAHLAALQYVTVRPTRDRRPA